MQERNLLHSIGCEAWDEVNQALQAISEVSTDKGTLKHIASLENTESPYNPNTLGASLNVPAATDWALV
ncbi:MAG TPA: hypothetical protein V6C84_14500 [Coleofasciculaceae cyanobacterium]|jgi:hypothetical protein